MKKIKKYIIVILSILAFSNCDDFLKENLYSVLDESSFPQESQMESLVNEAYARALHAYVVHHRLAWATHYATPETMYKYREPHDRGSFDRWSWQNYRGNPAYFDLMDRIWRSIRSSNDAIKLIPNVDAEDKQRQAELVAEAQFMRAFNYFMLVRLWGGMPIIDKAQDLTSELYPSRTSIAETYDFIVKDLKEASEALPKRSALISRGIPLGHATKSAALGLLGKVYATMAGAPLNDASKWTEAQTVLEQVISMESEANENGLLAGDYSLIFDWKNGNNKEILFSLQMEGINQSAYALQYYVPAANCDIWLPPGITGINYDLVEPDFAKWYMTKDNGPRKQWNIITEWVEHVNDTTDVTHVFTDGSREAAYSGKYRCPDYTEMSLNSQFPNDVPFLRFADILLLHSEVLNEINGPNSAAYEGINRVRNRAELADLTSGLNKEAFRDSVYVERRLELCFEYDMLFDIRRRGFDYAKDYMENYYDKTNPNGYAGDFQVTVDARDMLYPIPISYLNANPSWQQNPGY